MVSRSYAFASMSALLASAVVTAAQGAWTQSNNQTRTISNTQTEFSTNIHSNVNVYRTTRTHTYNGVVTKTVDVRFENGNVDKAKDYQVVYEDYSVDDYSSVQRDCVVNAGNANCNKIMSFEVEPLTGLQAADAINDVGEVAGMMPRSDTDDGWLHAAIWRAGEVTDLGIIGCRRTVSYCMSRAWGINDRGHAVGESNLPSPYGSPYYSYWSMYYTHETLWAGGQGEPIKALGWELGVAKDINNRGSIVGHSRSVDWVNATGDYLVHGFVNTGDQVYEIGNYGQSSKATAVNENDRVTGSIYDNGLDRAFIWHFDMMLMLGHLGGGISAGEDINNREDGHVVGASTTSAGYRHGFLRVPGVMYDLGTLPNHVMSSAAALNDRQQIVGISYRGLDQRAVLWQGGEVFDLNELLVTPIDEVLFKAVDINNRGQIIARSRSGYFLLTPVVP